MARPAVRNERWLVAVAAGLVLAGGITYVAMAGPVTEEHLPHSGWPANPRRPRS